MQCVKVMGSYLNIHLNLIYVLLLLLTLSHGRPSARLNSTRSRGREDGWMDNETLGEEEWGDEDQDDQDDQHRYKFRVNILKELGFEENIPQTVFTPKVNISKAEYVAAYAKYMRNVRQRKEAAWNNVGSKRRRKNATTRTLRFSDYGTGNGDLLTFHFELSPSLRGRNVRIRKAEIKVPASCRVKNYSQFKGQHQGLATYDLTQAVISWLFHSNTTSPSLEVTASCSSLAVPSSSTLQVVTSELPPRGRSRRSSTNSSLQSFKGKQMGGRECAKTRRGKTCCRRSLKVKFSELGISDYIIEPHEFDAHVCVGRCNAKRVSFSSAHAMFQHILHQTKGKKFAPRPCCAPTKLVELDVLHLDPSKTKLEVTVLKDAIVTECGCS